MKLSSQTAETLFGDQKAPDGSRISDNFTKWFGSSKLVTSQGSPMPFHHGSGNLTSILDQGFSYDFAGRGNDQLGPGWYFTNTRTTAEGYTTRRMGDNAAKIGGETAPGVLDVFLALRNPIQTHDKENWHEQLPDLTAAQAQKLLLASPGIRDPEGPLSNWGDIESEGFERVFRQAVKVCTGPSHFTIGNDFFRNDPKSFLTALHEVTGHDGVVHRFLSGEIHAVAWLPSQIKAATLNNGLFDLECSDVSDARSARNPVPERLLESRAKVAAEMVKSMNSEHPEQRRRPAL